MRRVFKLMFRQGTSGNNKPASLFNQHYIAIVNKRAYDPAYGKEYSLPSEFENVAISGFYRDEPLWMANGVATPAILFRKNPNGINIQWEQRTY